MESYNQLLELFVWSNKLVDNGVESANTALNGWDKNELKRYEKDGNSILHRSCINGWYDVSIRLIEEFGLDPNVRDQDGNTALHSACRFGNVKLVVKLITSYKCDPLLLNNHGNTPLHCAIIARDREVVQSLINVCGRGSLKSAMNDDIMAIAWEHWDDDIIKCLINEGGCGLNSTIVHQCVNQKHNRLRFLLENCRWDPNVRDENGNTILHTCAFMGDSNTFKYFVTNHDCKPNIENNKGETPLHIICSSLVKQGYSDDKCKMLFFLLMDVKVSPHIKFNDSDISVLFAVCKAIINGNHDPSILCYLIIDCGCDPSNEINLILYTLCNTICRYEFKHIDILYQLVMTKNIGPYLTLENGNKVCIMCYPVKQYGQSNRYLTYQIATQANTFVKCISQSIDSRQFSIAYMADFINLSYHFFMNVKHECNFNLILIDCIKKVYPREGISLSLLHRLVTTFGFSNSTRPSDDSVIDADTLTEMIQKNNDITICFRNPLHSARIIICCLKPYSSSIYSLFYDLINSSELDLMSKADIFGNTLLHLACLFYHGDSTLIEYLLSTGKTDSLCVNDYQQTPQTLLALSSKDSTNNEFNISELVSKFGERKVSHPIESYVNIIVLGNPGVGKSTLVKVINDRHDVSFRQFRSVTGVEHCTAGIVPHVLNDKDMGRIIVHDLAGQVEYYSSHTAVLSNLLQTSAAVFVIVVSFADERSTESLKFWLSVVENASSKASKQYHVFVVVSRFDTNVAGKKAKLKGLQNELLKVKSDIICHTDIFRLDCRKLGGGQLNLLIASLSDVCESVRSNNVREISPHCHALYDFLRSCGKAVYSLNELVEALKGKNYFLPTETNELFNIIQSLSSTGLIMYLGNPPDKVWIIADKSVLLKNLNGVLFASEYFKEHVDQLISKTGIVKLSELCNHLRYDPDMIVQFLESMGLSYEISNDFILSSNLAPLENVMSERYLFIPALIMNSDRPDNTDQFQFGWCLQCFDVHSFFLSQFIHLIMLHLLKYTEIRSPDNPIEKYCHIWNNGIYWNTRDGVSVLVELFHKHKTLVLLMSFQSSCYKQMSSLRKAVISEILLCKRQVLLKTSIIEEFIVDNTDLQYPQILDRISDVPLYSIHEFCKCLHNEEKFVLESVSGRLQEVCILLKGTNIKEQCESVLAGRISKNLSENSKTSYVNSEYNARLKEAMAEFKGEITQLNVMLHGPPGVGKTSLFQVIVGKDPLPKEQQNSTDIMKNPVRAITADQLNEDNDGKLEQISDDKMYQLIAEYIKDLPEKKPIKNETYSSQEHLNQTNHHSPPHKEQAHESPQTDQQPHIANKEISSVNQEFLSVNQQTVSDPSSNKEHPDDGTHDYEMPSQNQHVQTAQHYTQQYKEIRDKLSNAEPSSRLFQSKWYNLIDSGGQPQFQDMLPLLFRSPSFQIVLMRLTEGLADKPKMCYTVEGENIVPSCDDLHLTNLQYIERACQIAADSNPPSKIMIVGTHKDKIEGEVTATLATLEKGLADLRKKYNDVIFPTSNGDSVFPMNTMAIGEVERKEYTKQMQNAFKSVTNAIAMPQPVPLRWFAFQLALRREHTLSVIKMDDCIKLGQQHDMDPKLVEDALIFFNQSALLLYYPNAAPDLVLAKVDPIIERLSKLVATTFKVPSELRAYSHLYTILKEKGLFDGRTFPFKQLFCGIADGLSCQKFFALLESLKLAVRVLVDKEEQQLYFLPSALSYLSSAEPAAHFKGGLSFGFALDRDKGKHILPHSFFFTTVVELLSNNEEYQFEICSDKQYRNRIQVYDKSGKIPGAVILFDKTWWLQVTMTSTNPSRCPTICKAVKGAIERAITKLKHIGITSYREVFPCPIEGHSEHYCTVTVDNKDYTCSNDESLTGPVTEDMTCWIEGENYFVKKIYNCLWQPEYRGAQGIIIVVGMFGPAGTTIDVQNIRETFKRLGFAVLPVQDPTAEDLANLIKAASQVNYPSQLNGFRFFCFYFTGHGGADGDNYENLFIRTAETNATQAHPILYINEKIIDPLKDLTVPYRLFLFDCCQTPGTGQVYHSNPTNHPNRKVKENVRGQVVACAVSRGQAAVGDTDKGGLWTRHLCENITEMIPLVTVLKNTAKAVSPQISWFTIGISDDVIVATQDENQLQGMQRDSLLPCVSNVRGAKALESALNPDDPKQAKVIAARNDKRINQQPSSNYSEQTSIEESSESKEDLKKKVEKLESQIKTLQLENESLKLHVQSDKSPLTCDVGLQFNYVALERDHIQGVTISQAKLFTVRGDQQHSFIWDGYGFELHVPKGACLPEEECDIFIDIAVGGDFVFPKGVEPVSAIYIISKSNPSKPKQPSLLRLQHCVDLSNGRTKLCFYRALLNESTPPYHFKPVKEKGRFDISSKYGELQLPVYCGMAIGTRASNEQVSVNSDIVFLGKLFYRKKPDTDEPNDWKVKFVVAKKIDALEDYIKNYLHDHEEDTQLNFKFTKEGINMTLDEEVDQGWTVKPSIQPSFIMYCQATLFGYKKINPVPPTCSFDVYGDATAIGGYKKRLNCPLSLNGAMVNNSIPKVYIRRDMKEGQIIANSRPLNDAAGLITNDDQDVDYLKVYDRSSAKLVDAITNPRSLAPKLREAGLIARPLENKIAELIPGVSNTDNADLLIREVRKFIKVSHDNRNKQRQKLLSFCQVLMRSEDPSLSEIGSDILKNAGIKG